MSRFQDLLLKTATKKVLGAGITDAPAQDGQMPPFILNLLQSFGITPDAIRQIAEDFKQAVETRLSSIDTQLASIRAEQEWQREILEHIEHNTRKSDIEAAPRDIFPPDAQAPEEYVQYTGG